MGPALPSNCGNTYPVSTSDGGLAQVPVAVTVAPGRTHTTFTISTSAVAAERTVIITAADMYQWQTHATLTITP